jgi:hypothetical protein
MSKIIQVEQKSEGELKEYHRKKLYELSLKSVGVIPNIDEPTEEQKEWALRKLRRKM